MFDPCFTGVLCISSHVLISLVAPALCLTPVLCIFSSVVLSLFAPALCLTPCFTGVVCISFYVLLSLVAPALCLTTVLRVFGVSFLMYCYLLLLRQCVLPLLYGCFAYLFLCLVISCCSGIVFEPCFTRVLCISFYFLLSLVAPTFSLTPVSRVACVSLLMSCYHLLSLVAPALCSTPVLGVFFLYLFLCLVFSCCSDIVFRPFFTGV